MLQLSKLIGDGMRFLIKFLCLALISGCSLLNIDKLGKDSSIKITDEIKNSPYAMQIIKIDRSINEIFLLKSILNDEQIWFVEDDIFFTIIDGKIVKSIGLDNDFEILSYKGFQSLKNNKSLIRFKNPESDYMEILFSYKFVKEGIMKKLVNDEDFKYRLIEETFKVPLIKWSGKNYYWIDEENDIWMSKQIIDPYGKKARIVVLKKYSD